MKREFFKWVFLAFLSGVCLGLILWFSLSLSSVLGGNDPYCLVRYLLLRLTAVAVAAPALVGLMLLVDFVTPGDWMKAIGDDPKACSYLMSAVILVIGAVLCWT